MAAEGLREQLATQRQINRYDAVAAGGMALHLFGQLQQGPEGPKAEGEMIELPRPISTTAEQTAEIVSTYLGIFRQNISPVMSYLGEMTPDRAAAKAEHLRSRASSSEVGS